MKRRTLLATIADVASTTTVQAIRRLHGAQASNSYEDMLRKIAFKVDMLGTWVWLSWAAS